MLSAEIVSSVKSVDAIPTDIYSLVMTFAATDVQPNVTVSVGLGTQTGVTADGITFIQS
ncbi:hypothetical protein [Vannielia sp.]|uniref:hypothetical protein n=1 Tax=Vannielia sp. TaxID=2813045 RepID=UPI002608E62D|nr:hypothetical protein [Vannielia sp.]MDF1871892.1 hypothetical protein [Vannielia sp.]